MQLHHLHARRRRARGALSFLIVGIVALAAAFFHVQIISTTTFAVQSDANRLRPLSVPAPRGTVYDRNGHVIADNIPGYTLLVLPSAPDTLRAQIEALAELLSLRDAQIETASRRYREFPNQPVVVASDLSFDQLSAIEERRAFYPGVYIEMRPKRRYAVADTIAHVIGYVGEISRDELGSGRFPGYEPGQTVGKAGLERRYERILGGEPGIRYVEVDALGRVLADRTERPGVDPVPGEDLTLHLDLPTQRWIGRVFPDSLHGAVVALEPGTGHVLALYSRPSFDPNEFVGGIPPGRWRELSADSTDPLLNRAVAGLYPPGSTFKLASAALGLELGVVDPEEYMPIPCRGGMRYGNRYFECWERAGHGYLSLADAIKHSCNVYFYQLGVKIGLERFLTEANRLGFAEHTGIDVPGEVRGRFPSGADWYRERYGWAPTQAEVLNLAIGQGPNSQSVLKMAHFFAALASEGPVPAPRLADAGDAQPGAAALDIGLSQRSRSVLLDGMRGVLSPGGTAHLASLEHWDLLGKTGTSQNPHGEDHGWFVGMAGPPGEAPEVVVAAVLEFAGSGSVAAQYAAKTADYYLRRVHGVPTDTIQTLREHLMAGRPTPWARWQ